MALGKVGGGLKVGQSVHARTDPGSIPGPRTTEKPPGPEAALTAARAQDRNPGIEPLSYDLRPEHSDFAVRVP